MKIAGIQHDIIWENPEANFSNLQPMINEAAEKEVELIVLSELFSTGFSMVSLTMKLIMLLIMVFEHYKNMC